MIIHVVKIFLPTTLAFAIGIIMAPRLINYMLAKKWWKKISRTEVSDITNDSFAGLHDTKSEISTPRVGGIMIWGATLATISLMWIISKVFPSDLSAKLDFYSRNQTLVPLASLLFGAMVGLFDDFIQINGGSRFFANDDIKYRRIKIAIVAIVGALIGSWFFFKLGVSGIAIPFVSHPLYLGFLFIPFFIFVLVATFSTSVIDGMDGLAGGVLAIIFGAYAGIAYGKEMVDIAALCGVISGSILAFLWFNVPPAKFYMGETGILGLTVLLTVVAFLTDTVLLLPIIALPLVATSASIVIQITGYKYFNKKRVFKIAPLHHHFHALGWSREKIVMRYWIVGMISAIAGLVLALVS